MSVDVHLSDDQTVVLREVLDAALRDLRFEIADTDNSFFRERLRGREVTLRELLAPLGGPLPDQPLAPEHR